MNSAELIDDRLHTRDPGHSATGTGRLRGATVVVPQQPAEAFAAHHDALAGADALTRLDQLVSQPLVIPFAVIVGDVLADRTTQRSFAEEDHAVQALLFDRAHEALGPGVQVGRARWQTKSFATALLEDPAERLVVFAVAVDDQEALPRRNPSTPSVRLRATCIIQRVSGCGVAPAKQTRRVDSSMAIST